jgi:hypothetical protein
MNPIKYTLALSALFLAFFAQAHDPKLHKQQAQPQSPDCAALQQMDKAEMDMTDPVVQAMMQQCMDQMQHGDELHSKMKDKDAKAAEKEQQQERHEGH